MGILDASEGIPDSQASQAAGDAQEAPPAQLQLLQEEPAAQAASNLKAEAVELYASLAAAAGAL